MLTGVAIIPTGLAGLRDLPYGWEFVVVVILDRPGNFRGTFLPT
jgi:hypothetical protein